MTNVAIEHGGSFHSSVNLSQRVTMFQQLKHGGISWDIIYINIYIYTQLYTYIYHMYSFSVGPAW